MYIIFQEVISQEERTIKKAIISGDKEIVNLDRMNVEIINKLNENSRKNFSHIANELNTTSKTIILRVKNLERKKVIREYGININHTKIGIKKYLLFISFNFMHSKGENILADFSHKCPNIIELIKTFGRWDATSCDRSAKRQMISEKFST